MHLMLREKAQVFVRDIINLIMGENLILKYLIASGTRDNQPTFLLADSKNWGFTQ